MQTFMPKEAHRLDPARPMPPAASVIRPDCCAGDLPVLNSVSDPFPSVQIYWLVSGLTLQLHSLSNRFFRHRNSARRLYEFPPGLVVQLDALLETLTSRAPLNVSRNQDFAVG
jgi:hypothetical protein